MEGAESLGRRCSTRRQRCGEVGQAGNASSAKDLADAAKALVEAGREGEGDLGARQSPPPESNRQPPDYK